MVLQVCFCSSYKSVLNGCAVLLKTHDALECLKQLWSSQAIVLQTSILSHLSFFYLWACSPLQLQDFAINPWPLAYLSILLPISYPMSYPALDILRLPICAVIVYLYTFSTKTPQPLPLSPPFSFVNLTPLIIQIVSLNFHYINHVKQQLTVHPNSVMMWPLHVTLFSLGPTVQLAHSYWGYANAGPSILCLFLPCAVGTHQMLAKTNFRPHTLNHSLENIAVQYSLDVRSGQFS